MTILVGRLFFDAIYPSVGISAAAKSKPFKLISIVSRANTKRPKGDIDSVVRHDYRTDSAARSN